MNPKYVYLALAVIGFVVPYYFFLAFVRVHGLNGELFLQELFGTRISCFFAADLLISCLVFVRYLRREATRFGIDKIWIYLLALVTVGLSLALPLFLYVRESRIEAGARSEP